MDNHDNRRRQQLHAALLEILDEAMHVDKAACGKIRIYNPESGRLEIGAQRGFSDDFVKSFEAVSQHETLACARAFRQRRRVTVPDVAADPFSEPYRSVASTEGFKAMQATPLMASDGRVVGTLSTHFPRAHHPSTSAALVLDYLSQKAAGVIESLGSPPLART